MDQLAPRAADETYELLADFFDNAPVALHWQDESGTIKHANPALARLLGCDLAQLPGRNIADFYAERAAALEVIGLLSRGEAINSHPVRLRGRGGAIVHVLMSANVLHREGRFVHARVFTRDIFELHQSLQALEAADARKAAILEASLDAILTMDAQGQLLDFNHAAERIFGYRREEAVTRRLSELIIPPALRAAHEDGLRRYLLTGSGPVLGKRIEIIAMRASGEEFPVELSISVVRGEQPLFTATVRDISERKAAERELRETLLALRQGEAELRNDDRRKDEFIATLAHELRNPLAPVRTAAEILAMPAVAAERVAWAADIIRRQVSVMARLLDDLLDVARIKRGALELRRSPVTLQEVIAMAVQTVQPLIAAKQQRLETHIEAEPGHLLEIDGLRIAQVITNLLTNASRYSEPERRIFLTAQIREGTAVIEVRDEGIGFASESLPELFVLFSQLPQGGGRQQGGLGVGLALSRRLVELHGGSLEASSGGLGKGATFRVTLPAQA